MGNFNAKSLFDSCHKELELDGRRTLNAKHNVQEEIDKNDIKSPNVTNIEQKVLMNFSSDNNPVNLANSEQSAINKGGTNLKGSDVSEDCNKNENNSIIPPNSDDIIELRKEWQVAIKPEDVKGEFWIHQSNPTGVCSTCLSGLGNADKEPGVVKQLSLLYPNLVINVSSDEVEGVKPRGRKFFKIQNGTYVED